MTWEQIGPDLEVNVVAVAPATGDTVLVSAFEAATRQLYRTADGGASWSPVAGLLGVTDIEIDPRRPCLAYAAAYFPGGSVLKSEDGGVTWTEVAADNWARVLSLDPSDGRRVYTGTAYGRVLRSSDWGATWVDIGVNPPLWLDDDISDIAVDPSDSSTIFVSTFDYESGGTGIYKTEDSGATWQSLGWPGEEGTPPGPIWYVSRLHASADHPGRLIAGAGVYNFGVTGAIYETVNGGADWNSLSVSGIPDITYLTTLALESLVLRHDTVLLGVDHFGGPDEIFYSIDSGRGWRVLVEGILDDSEHGFDIATDDSQRVYYTTGAGIVRSSTLHDPSIVYADHVIDDAAGGNGDGHVDPGEAISLDIELRNLFGHARGVSATLSTPDVFITVTQPYSGYPDLVWGSFGASLAAYEFEVDLSRPPGPLEFTLEIAAEGFSTTEVLFIDPRILVVDDDDFGLYESSYTEALEENHLAYDLWSIVPDGPVTAELLGDYDVVVWFTSAMHPGMRGTTLSADEELLLAQYLDDGGRLLLSSQDYLAETSGSPLSAFATDYLHLAGRFEDTSKPGVAGVPGDPIGDGVYIATLDYPFDNLADTVFPDSLAATVLAVEPGVGGAAVRFPSVPDSSSFRTVFLAFPFEAIPEGGSAPNDRGTIIRRAIEWLVPEGGLVPTGVPDEHTYSSEHEGIVVHCSPNPSHGPVRLSIESRRGAIGEARVTVYDIAGRRVWESHAQCGRSGASVDWDGCDGSGNRVSSGVYLVRVSAGGESCHAKVVQLR
jgi:photosystem II stability/assembly factor-like uncharacterized protein